MDMVELFFEIVYPIFPLFHQPTFLHQISRAKYTSDRSLFTVTMATCALVSARVRDGAVFNPRWDLASLQHPLPEVYYQEAVRELHQQSSKTDINILRSHVILALAAIQDGNVRDMQMNIGRYHTIVATEGLHDEDNWSQGLGLVEIEERRRLFWSVYTFDIFTSIVWGGVIRSREYQSNVSYPTEVDDDMFDDSGFVDTESPSNTIDNSRESAQQGSRNISWIAGRNFVIDLYRVLEHIMMRLASRKGRAQRRTLADEVLQASDSLSQESVLNSVMEMYARLPQCLKVTNPVTSRARLDRFGFQAADIIATIQLLRMVLLSAVGAGIAEKCQVANEVVSAFIAIPATYHHAISVPLLFHLSIIVQIMATTMEQPLTEGDYNKIRDIMMSMVRLLSTLECLHASKDASQRLKDQVARIDNYMAFQHHDVPNQTGTTFSTGNGSPSTGKPFSEAMPATLDQTALNDTLAQLPLQLPSDLLGDLSQIFDFSHMP
ncbi:hypothetical protein PRZ48_013596 [Zasmidium cellare]|uniref:Xylanolytic transcriptional activator regulatory domain-containing protein n=1 Tax=Zasmidium cellare TaxID=395010 RepID=A0ABR0E1I2_ZASCE|nr:hypothetical protein PRZ48_013596 [Zasmidium cellare]